MTKRAKNVVSDPDVPEAAAEPEPAADAAPDAVPAVEQPAVPTDGDADRAEGKAQQDALAEARAALQAARERASDPNFVPAESEESKTFRKLQADAARRK